MESLYLGVRGKKFENPCVRNVYMEFMFPAHAEKF